MTTSIPTTFQGFRPEAIQFLVDLAENNSRDWFQPRKADFERLLKAADGGAVRRARGAVPERATSRSTRTRPGRRSGSTATRASRRTRRRTRRRLAASFGWAGDGGDAAAGRSHTENVHASGGYFHLQPGEIYVGGGVWHPDKSWLDGFRQRIVDDSTASSASSRRRRSWTRSARSATTASRSSACRRAIPADHPAADLLRKKNVTFGRRLSDDEALSPDLPTLLADTFAAGTPLLRYLAGL